MDQKPFWTSKTLWANFIAGTMATFMEWDNPEHVATALAALNIVLRFFTNKYLGA
jgi:hypothetical protein